MQSLKYASYIQQALLPSGNEFRKWFPEHFIFYQPRDIVSGDFYYINQRDDQIILAVADCTGHGVPGAFMSILGITYLNEIINSIGYFTAGSILNHLRERIMKALCQTGNEDEQKDGLDIALCIINKKNNILNFAGAFNPLYIVREDDLIEIQGDLMPVGIAPDEEKPFTSHQFELINNDVIYLFSDGFADQFGGPNGKKFKYKPFREVILKNSTLDFKHQLDKLSETFHSWKGNLNQLDDVLVVGCRYHIT
jgi:serine phosphatase RsbU (regulator of sigma subunit)